MKSHTINQVKEMLLEGEIDFKKISREDMILFAENYPGYLSYELYIMMMNAINDINSENSIMIFMHI